MVNSIEFISGALVIIGTLAILLSVFTFLGWIFEEVSWKVPVMSFIGGIILWALSILAHYVYLNMVEIPRTQHIEYYLNNQNRFQVDSVEIAKNSRVFKYNVQEKH